LRKSSNSQPVFQQQTNLPTAKEPFEQEKSSPNSKKALGASRDAAKGFFAGIPSFVARNDKEPRYGSSI
jgi:hypothetical protein